MTVPDCTECEHCSSQDHHREDSEGRLRVSHTTYDCRNWDFPKIVNGVKSCELMRATVCGTEGKGFIQIDWAALEEEKRIWRLRLEKQKKLMKTIPYFVYKPWLFFIFLFIPVIGWLAILGHWMLENSWDREKLFDEKYKWNDEAEDYERQ